MSYQEFHGTIAIDSTCNNFSVGASALTITSGDYFISTLCAHLQTLIRAIGATQDSSTVSYSGTTGLVTITLETSATITWADAGVATILGFPTTARDTSTSHVASQRPRHVWRPSSSAWEYPSNLIASQLLSPRSTTLVGRAPGGTTWSVKGSLLYDGAITYRALPSADVIPPTTGSVYLDLRQFWIDVVHEGKPIRFFHDRTDSASYVDVMWTAGTDSDSEEGAAIGTFEEFAERHISNYNGFWDVTIPLAKHVSL